MIFINELIRYHFSDSLQSGFKAYKIDCADYFKHHQDSLNKTKIELELSILNLEFDWKKIFRHNNFFLFSERKTQEELLIDLKLLCWSIFFPKSVLTNSELDDLKTYIGEQLIIDNEQSILKLNESSLINYSRDQLKDTNIELYQIISLFYDPTIFSNSNGGNEIIKGFHRLNDCSYTMICELDNAFLFLTHKVGSNFWTITKNSSKLEVSKNS